MFEKLSRMQLEKAAAVTATVREYAAITLVTFLTDKCSRQAKARLLPGA